MGSAAVKPASLDASIITQNDQQGQDEANTDKKTDTDAPRHASTHGMSNSTSSFDRTSSAVSSFRRRNRARVRVSRQISSGTCCKLFLGEIEQTGETVALKLYTKTSRGSHERKNELKVLQAIESAPEVCEFVITPKLSVQEPFIGLEYCVGSDLTHSLRRGLPCLSELQRFGREIALGVAFLHRCNIVHEDLKPENIGLTADNHVRILDFGLSVAMEAPVVNSIAPDGVEPTRSRVLCRHGTAPYTSPEKLLGELHGFEVDWWSFGVIMFEMAYGALPWYSPDDLELCEMICSSPLSIPSPTASNPSCSFVDDLTTCLLGSKESEKCLGYYGGANAVLDHAFFKEDFSPLQL